MGKLIPKEWMPQCRMDRVHLHWTAGPRIARPDEYEHYHFIVNQDMQILPGVSIKLNSYASAATRPAGYAAHTLGANQYAIGISMAGMRGAVERPFNPGPDPITEEQWRLTVRAVAELCEFYKIPVTPKTVLSHAEVESNLGIKQKGKWDVTVLPWQTGDKRFDSAKECGDLFRAEVKYVMENGPPVILK